MTARELDQRLAAIERDLALLKNQGTVAIKSHPVHALESIHGIFENDEAFHEAMRLGRKWRESDGLAQRKSKAKRK